MLNIYSIPTFLSAVSALLIGVFVVVQNTKSKINRSFFKLTLATFLWQIGTAFALISSNPEIALNSTRIGFLGIALIPVTTYKLVISFLGTDRENKRIVAFGYLINFLCFIPLSWTPYMFNGVYKFHWGYWYKAGFLHPIFLIFFGYFMLLTFYQLYNSYKREKSPFEKNRKKYLLLALLIAYIGIEDYLPTYGLRIYPFGYFTVIGCILILAFAIVRYRLMDINIVLTRAGIFAFVYFLVLGIPFWVGFKLLGMGLWIIPVSITAVFATFGPFGYQILRSRAEDVILKEQKRYQKTLRELSKTMTRIRDLDELLKTVTSTIKDTVKVNYSAIYIKDEQYNSCRLKSYYANGSNVRLEEFIPLDSRFIKLIYSKKMPLLGEEVKTEEDIPFDFGLITPYFMEDELLGFLILGSKPNNQMYTPDDVLVFETLSYSTSLAIENSTFWKEIEDRHRKARLQEMDTYSYSLAHEIDNPMQVVLGQAGLLKKEVTDNIADEGKRSEIIGSFDFIIEAAKRVSGMVKAIRDFGQKTTGEFKALNIEDVTDSFARLYYPQFKDKTVFFEKINNLKNPIFIRGEKPELMQVLVILANNSVHAMTDAKEKKATLILGLSNRDLVRITFTDNGYGIKKEMLEIIFKPFVTTKASTEGTGMGLHNAQKIIEKHKGKIWAESEGPGKGASFIIELPIAKDVTQDEVKKEDSKSKRLI